MQWLTWAGLKRSANCSPASSDTSTRDQRWLLYNRVEYTLATSLSLHLIAWPLGILLLFVLVVVAFANMA